MERYKCRYCFKSFINGSALGGHMRSHMLNLSSKRDLYELSLKEEKRPSQLSNDDTESDTSSDDDDDHESETDSSRINPTRKRTKRTRKLGSFDLNLKKMKTSQPGESVTEFDHHSSASDTTTEEDLAFCLIMLSRDKWVQHSNNKKTNQTIEEEDESEDYKSNKNRGVGGRGRFKCETCSKVFRSYQALGGHRASHKKKNMTTNRTEYVNGVTEKRSVHECPVCLRVFSSGQALGGHKRSHGNINVGSPRRGLSVNQIVKQRMIDLNLPPAPNEEDDDDDETSLVFDEC